MVNARMTREEVAANAAQRFSEKAPQLPSVDAQAVQDFRDMVRLLERHGTTVISVEVPYSPPYQQELERLGDYDKQRQAAAAEITRRADVTHHPVEQFGSWWGDGDSRDAIHLSPQGAKEFTKQLLDDVPDVQEHIIEGLE